MSQVKDNSAPLLETQLGLHDEVYIRAMHKRTREAVAPILEPKSKASKDAKSWAMRQILLQTLRVKGMRVILHKGDIGYSDQEMDDIFREASMKIEKRKAEEALALEKGAEG